MTYSHSYSKLLFLSIMLMYLPVLALAQNEVQREQNSLLGISELGFTVNLEANVSLNEKSELEVTSVLETMRRALMEADITVVPDERIRSSDQIPFLYMHINSMDAGQGLVPFSISLNFYQPVKLVLNRDLQSSASTWETGMVGIVSYDQMHIIEDAGLDLIQEFINDFRKVNL